MKFKRNPWISPLWQVFSQTSKVFVSSENIDGESIVKPQCEILGGNSYYVISIDRVATITTNIVATITTNIIATITINTIAISQTPMWNIPLPPRRALYLPLPITSTSNSNDNNDNDNNDNNSNTDNDRHNTYNS